VKHQDEVKSFRKISTDKKFKLINIPCRTFPSLPCQGRAANKSEIDDRGDQKVQKRKNMCVGCAWRQNFMRRFDLNSILGVPFPLFFLLVLMA
jgi:hypothetical protein